MGIDCRDFNRAHPFDSPEFVLILTELDGLIVRSEVLSAQQREGFIDQHAGAIRKRELEARMRRIHLPHLAQAGESAARVNHELATTFKIRPPAETLAAFRTAAGSMAAAAETHKVVLTGRGMSLHVLEDLRRALKEFDIAAELGTAGRAAHVGASAELKIVGDEIVKRVRLLDAVNRLRFQDDPSLLAAWQSVSKVRATPKSGGQAAAAESARPGAAAPAAPDVRPAA